MEIQKLGKNTVVEKGDSHLYYPSYGNILRAVRNCICIEGDISILTFHKSWFCMYVSCDKV